MSSKEQKLYDAGLKAQAAGQLSIAIAKYQACLKLAPNAVPALNNLGHCLLGQRRYQAALKVLRRAEALSPQNPTILGNLATCCRQVGDLDGACDYLRRRSLVDDDVENLRLLSASLRAAKKGEEALETAKRVCAGGEASLADFSNLLHLARNLCDWDCASALSEGFWAEKLAASPEYAGSPFRFYSHLADPLLLKDIARRAARHAASAIMAPAGAPVAPPDRIRLGFISQDFRDHPMLKLIAGLIVDGPRMGFDIYLYALGPESDDPRRTEIKKAATAFRMIEHEAAAKIAERIRRDNLHALVDLMGYTRNATPEVLAHRPAPLQISWLGLPGTTGASWIDYIIADDIVIPPGAEAAFDETVIRLSPSYYPFDDRTARSTGVQKRADHGLPEEAFVFASFNQSFKICPERFDTWCAALTAVPSSVLWLMAPPEAAVASLRAVAAARGIAQERLIFAPRTAHESHLARLGLADLMLDTWLYGGHTTTIDALWAGVPVLTRIGPTFTSRVAASILSAAGMPDLVAETEAAYLDHALTIATDQDYCSDLTARCEGLSEAEPPFATACFSKEFYGKIRAMLTA